MYTVRLVEDDDLEKLAKSMSAAFTAADPEKPWDEPHSLGYLKYWYQKQPDMFFGAYDENGEPVGALAVNIKPWRTGIRCSDGGIFVDVAHQNRGIAKMLSKKALEEAMQKYNTTMVEAISFAGNQFPLTWYKKLGFLPDEHAVIIKGDCQEILTKLG